MYNVVIQTAFIGDLFLTIPTFFRLKKEFPNHKTVLVCKKGLGSYFLKKQIVDLVFEIQKGKSSSYSHVADKINELPVDAVFCLHRSWRSVFFSRKIRSQRSYGFHGFLRNYFFTKTVSFPQSWPEALRQMSLLSEVSPEVKNLIDKKDWTYLNFVSDKNCFFPDLPKEFKICETKISSNKKIVALFPGSVWPTKKWTENGFRQVMRYLLDRQFQVKLMGGPDELEICQRLALQINSNQDQVEILAGQMSLADSVDYISNCDFIVCNDSAPAHMAAAVGVPVIAVFGPTVTGQGFRPWVDGSQVVEKKDLKCRPCGAHGHKTCPLVHHDCMRQISADEVIKAIENLKRIR